MDPQVEALLQMMAAQAQSGAPQMTDLPAAEARANAEVGYAAFNQPMPATVSVADRLIPGSAGELPVKVFTPLGAGPFPLLVYIHGGGWVIGSPGTHTKLCAELSEGAGAVVVSVGYRLAPEHVPPAQLDDCVAAIRWAVEHAGDLNADGSRFAVGGDSSGANLTAAAVLRLRDEGGPQAKLQLLFCGVFTGTTEIPSMATNGEGMLLSRKTMDWFYGHYLSGGADPADPYIAPIHGDLHGLPPALLIVGTADSLLDDSKLFAEKLQEAGVPTTLSIYEDQPHIFMQLSALLDAGKKAMAEASAALKKALN